MNVPTFSNGPSRMVFACARSTASTGAGCHFAKWSLQGAGYDDVKVLVEIHGRVTRFPRLAGKANESI